MKIVRERGISNTTYHRRCRGRQGMWWLRRDSTGDFVRIGDHRGDNPLDIKVDLQPGQYTLGCGPAGGHGYRETIDIPWLCAHCSTDITVGKYPDSQGQCPTCNGHLCAHCAGGWC